MSIGALQRCLGRLPSAARPLHFCVPLLSYPVRRNTQQHVENDQSPRSCRRSVSDSSGRRKRVQRTSDLKLTF
jgi:hypothetical protein